VSKKTLTFLDITTILQEKNFVTKTEMKKVTMIHGNIFFRFVKPQTGRSHCAGRHNGGGEALPKPPEVSGIQGHEYIPWNIRC